MADSPKKKRIVKNPETFRERAIKASVADDKPGRSHRVRSASSKALSPVARPVASAAHIVFDRQPFRFLGKILLPRYVRDSWKELRLVQWPSWSESRRLTRAVLIFAIIFGIAVAALDYVLEKAFEQLLIK
jgi:preprotein translocase SecE subunit